MSIINGTALLKSCIHGATSMLESDGTRRKQQRVSILLELFKDFDNDCNKILTFKEVLKKRTFLLLQERDKKGAFQTEWVCREAMSLENLQVNGTFRRTVWQRLRATVTPILGEIIAFVDKNCNLDVVRPSEEGNVKSTLWLQIFANPNLTVIQYDSFLSPVTNKPRVTIPVMSSTSKGKHEQYKFPFFLVIKDHMDNLLHNAHKLKGPDETSVSRAFQCVLDESEIASTLIMNANDEHHEELIHCYLEDFSQTVPKRKISEQISVEYKKIIQQSLRSVAALPHVNNKTGGFILTIPAIHVSYEIIRERLEHFEQIIKLYPGAIHSDVEENAEMVLDASALLSLLISLKPEPTELKCIVKRNAWLNMVRNARPVVERILDSEKRSKTDFYGTISRKRIKECRPLWISISVVKLFVEHVCPDTEAGGEIIKRSRNLLLALGKNVDLKKASSINTIENFLITANVTASVQHFKFGVRLCLQCKECINEPVALPCRHLAVVQKQSNPPTSSLTDHPAASIFQSTVAPAQEAALISHQNDHGPNAAVVTPQMIQDLQSYISNRANILAMNTKREK
ncbi:E3 ubiquitin-protein ligase RNF213-like [Saccoglossus kowalevskii]